MKNRTGNMHTFLYIVFLVIGLTLTYFGLNQYLLTSKILSVGTVTDAVVVELIAYPDGDGGNAYAPVFEYTDRSGIKKKYEREVRDAKPVIQIGDKIKLVYNPDNAREIKVLTFWGLYLWVIVLLSFAPPFLLIGGGYLLYSYR